MKIVLHSSAPTLPALIDRAGEQAAWRFVEFFTVNIRNKNTRAAYGQAAGAFLRWCECRGIMRIEDVRPVRYGACGGPARPRAHRRHGLRLRARFSRGESEGGGLFSAQKTLVAAPKREGRQGQRNGLPPKLEQYLDEYIAAAGIAEDKKGP